MTTRTQVAGKRASLEHPAGKMFTQLIIDFLTVVVRVRVVLVRVLVCVLVLLLLLVLVLVCC